MKNSKGKNLQFKGKPYRFAIIAARYNEKLMEELLRNTQETLQHLGVLAQNIEIVRVPGALELPLMALKLSVRRARKFDAIIALGIVIKGETAHFEYVSEHCYRGLMEVSLQTQIPIVFGVLTTYTLKQAQERTSKKAQNKGKEYAEAAIEMVQKLR